MSVHGHKQKCNRLLYYTRNAPDSESIEASVRFPGLRRLYPQVRAIQAEVLFART